MPIFKAYKTFLVFYIYSRSYGSQKRLVSRQENWFVLKKIYLAPSWRWKSEWYLSYISQTYRWYKGSYHWYGKMGQVEPLITSPHARNTHIHTETHTQPHNQTQTHNRPHHTPTPQPSYTHIQYSHTTPYTHHTHHTHTLYTHHTTPCTHTTHIIHTHYTHTPHHTHTPHTSYTHTTPYTHIPHTHLHHTIYTHHTHTTDTTHTHTIHTPYTHTIHTPYTHHTYTWMLIGEMKRHKKLLYVILWLNNCISRLK